MTPQQFFDACTLLTIHGVTGFTVTPELYIALEQHLEEANDHMGVTKYTTTPYLERPPVCFRGAPFKLDPEFK